MNPRRVRIFLAEKGVTVPMRTVDAAADVNRKSPFLALNPLGELPVLELDQIAQPIGDAFLHCGEFYSTRLNQLPAFGEFCRQRAAEAFAWLNGELAGREFIATDGYSMTDIVAQCAFVLGKAVGLRIPPELTGLTRWFAAVSTRPTARA